MNETCFLSIIVPVFNVRPYLRQCIDSILEQSFHNFELIVVDDGSTDGCSSICDEYAGRDRRIQVIHKENGGLSDARNAGIKAADGQYLLFIDGDDFIAPDSFTKIFDTLKNDGDGDVLFLNAVRYYDNGQTKHYVDFFLKNQIYQKTHIEVLSFLASLPQFPGSACLKLVKKDLIKSNGIYFAKELSLNEDVDWSIHLLLSAETFDYCDCDYYYYRQGRTGSITSSYSEKNFLDRLFSITKWISIIEKTDKYKDFSQFIYSILSYQYCILLNEYTRLHGKAKKNYRAKLKQISWLLDCAKDKRILFIKIFYHLFGLRAISFVLALYEKHR